MTCSRCRCSPRKSLKTRHCGFSPLFMGADGHLASYWILYRFSHSGRPKLTVFGCFGTFWPCNYNNLRCALSIKTTALAMALSAWKTNSFMCALSIPPLKGGWVPFVGHPPLRRVMASQPWRAA